MKKYIYLIVLPFVLVACNKAKQTTLNGQVRTFGTEEAIQHPPVKVQILHSEFGSTGLGGSNTYTPVGETWTDQDGYFTVSAELYKNDEYFLGVDPETVKEKFHYPAPSYGMIDFPDHLITQRGGTFTKNHDLVAYGWVRFHFVNKNNNERLSYSVGGGGYEEFFNPQYEIIRIWDFGGNVEQSIALGKTKNNIDSVWREYFFVPALDTLVYKVNY
jgi:hypothetical protein